MFEPNSRYYALEDKLFTTSEGRKIAYKSRRFLPSDQETNLNTQLRIVEGDRLDLIAARTFGDPQVFWQIVDVNKAMNPKNLTEEPGAVIDIPLFSL